jgi:hypothetical protein
MSPRSRGQDRPDGVSFEEVVEDPELLVGPEGRPVDGVSADDPFDLGGLAVIVVP